MDINIQILIGGRGAGVFLRRATERHQWAVLFLRGQSCCFPANREEQQRRGYSKTPEDPAAEGKPILKLRHESADEPRRQLKHTHRRSTSGLHKASALMCPCTLPDKAGVRPKTNPEKSSIQEKRRSLHAWKSLGFVFPVIVGVNPPGMYRHTWCLLSVICHLKSYQLSENIPRGSLTRWRQTMKVKCSAKNSSVCQSHSWDIMYALCAGAPSSALNRALVVTQRWHYFKRHNKIDVFKE